MNEEPRDELSAAAAAMARASKARMTEAQAAASRENGQLGGRPWKPLEDYPCTCAGSGLDHKTTCARGLAIRRRIKAGKL